ncbi:MAG TPA: NAD(P)-dependent oxidoreductase [Desulfobacteraceae bacterium]|nr:NAD(P)-dependent oxidoreductase [Desulfobacteraceae bacterium]
MDIGFIGLGSLGRAIAGRLLDSGHSLTVWNRTPGKETGLGAEWVGSPAAMTGRAGVIFLCLFDSRAVRQVLTESDGLFAGDVGGKIIIDLTTNHFRDVADFHGLCAARGAAYLEAPVLGSVVPASRGELTVLVSGEKEAFDRTRPLLDDIGKHVFYLARPSMATRMKLINNLALGGFMATIAEALALGEKTGLKPETILDILSVGGGNSLVLAAKKNKLLTGDFSTHFSAALMRKDLHCLMDLAYDQQSPLFMGAMAGEIFAMACAEGLADEDFSAVYRIFRGRKGNGEQE